MVRSLLGERAAAVDFAGDKVVSCNIRVWRFFEGTRQVLHP
jgi:hypothetical protein